MFRRACLAAAFVVLALYSGSAQPGRQRLPALDRSRPFVAGELLVGFRDGISPSDIDVIYQGHGLRQVENLDAGPGRRALRRVSFTVTPAADVADQTARAIAALTRNPLVRFAEPNYILHTSLTPNDPRYGELYGLHNIGQTYGSPDADVDAPEAWETHTGSPGVIVFVIDTGVDYTHEDLTENVWRNPGEIAGNGVDDDNNGYVDDVHGINAITESGNPMDDAGHGTHVAGTIGARGNNARGVVGVAWAVSIGACKFLNSAGTGTLADAVECFKYVNRLKAGGQNVVVTNNSWGGGGFSQALLEAMDAVDQPSLDPILHVCAAGNDNANNDALPSFPASYDLPNIVAVAATDHNDVYASFSNFGASSVDLAAPGVGVLSTVPAAGAACCSDPTGYKLLSGTSMATPFVSGAAALLRSKYPGLNAAALKSRLLGGVDSIASANSTNLKQTFTQGRLNVSTSLEMGSDVLPPDAIVTLTVASRGLTSVTLTWIATGDDGVDGTASSYDVRYSTEPLVDGASWDSAVRAQGEPAPQPSGSDETYVVDALRPGTTYYFAVRALDNGGNQSPLSNVVQAVTESGVTVLQDDMSSAGTWVLAGKPNPPLWHITQRSSNSAPYAWWYGSETSGTYSTRQANWGTLTREIDLTGYSEAFLSFWEWSEVEATPTFDRTRVQASRDGTTWFTVFESHGTAGAWAERWVDLSAYAGAHVHLRFYFDTFDTVLNEYEGWYVDDVKVVGLPAAAAGLVAAFSANPTSGFAPLTVQFTDESVPPQDITSWNWQLGGGLSSSEPNPTRTYLNPGTYTVALTVTDGSGVASLTKNGYIVVRPTVKVASIDYTAAGRDLLIPMKVVNWAGAAVAGATVEAALYRGGTLVKSFLGTSNLDGTLTFKLKNAGSGCYTTTLKRVSSTNHEWDGVTPSNEGCR